MLIIDRFEGEYAVCECETDDFVHIRRSLLPVYAKEGDVIAWAENAFVVDEAQTLARTQRIRSKLDRLFAKKHTD